MDISMGMICFMFLPRITHISDACMIKTKKINADYDSVTLIKNSARLAILIGRQFLLVQVL